MALVLFLLFLIIASIGVQSSPANDPEILQDAPINSDDIPLEMELALERVRQEDASTPAEHCLKLGEMCRNSKISCCKTQTLKGGDIRTTDGVCFLFGEGRCEARVNIPNYNRYLELAKKANESNYRSTEGFVFNIRRRYFLRFFYRALLRGL
ncbi:uncharacterized protein LOC133525243 [Cydia pomonella]|uniref:uncharacterized protein LOC133525243 n=1 Tax=Cydia pomonella TaxID=82600 RepID=UPI002ADE0DF8|nr:uncharacterized protein LOC133525243 [Cydia pomonella]